MAKYRDLTSAAVDGSGSAESLGALVDVLLPILVDRLAATGLGEIEVERNGATVRVRSESFGAVSGAGSGAGTTRTNSATNAGGAQAGAHVASQNVVAQAGSSAAGSGPAKHAVAATAVGFLVLAKEIYIGAKVAKGAHVASVEVLGIPTEVRAPRGGIVVLLKAATGDPVEYGQEIFILESIGEVAT